MTPNQGEGSSIPLKYTVAICTGMREKTLGTTQKPIAKAMKALIPKFTVTWIRLVYLTSVVLLFSFIPLDYESMVVVLHGINFYTDFHRRKSFYISFRSGGNTEAYL